MSDEIFATKLYGKNLVLDTIYHTFIAPEIYKNSIPNFVFGEVNRNHNQIGLPPVKS